MNPISMDMTARASKACIMVNLKGEKVRVVLNISIHLEITIRNMSILSPQHSNKTKNNLYNKFKDKDHNNTAKKEIYHINRK